MELENTLLQEFFKLGPVITIMGVVIFWLAKRLEKKEVEIKELQNKIIDLQIKNIEAIKELTNCLELIEKDIENLK